MTINIKNNEYEIKQTIRALFLWEQITDRQFELKNTLDNYLYFYCLLLASNKEFMDFDSFINELDSDPTILIQISKAIASQNEIDKLFDTDEKDSDGKKKD